MILNLVEMPANLKGPDDPAYKGTVPRRMRFLAPDVGPALLELEKAAGGLVYTDMWRSAESSLAARRVKRGVQRPGYSPHGYGFAVDLDLYETMRRHRIKYGEILEVMTAHNWYCHRRDGVGPDEMEAWHFNYLGPDAGRYLSKTTASEPKTWANAAEFRILERYASDFAMTPTQIQTTLSNLKLYSGELDGDLTSMLCREAVMAFQRTWDLDVDGDAGPMTQRTLSFVTAQKLVTKLLPIV